MLERSAVRGIKLYRKLMYPVYNLTGLTGANSICKLQPSCSHFGEQALHEHGLGKAFVMTAGRIYECGLARSGVSPVPAAPHSLTQEEKLNAVKTLAAIAAVSAVCYYGMQRKFR